MANIKRTNGVYTGSDLSEKQLEAVDLLVEGGHTQGEICTKIGISPNTLYRWKKNSSFMDIVLEEARSRLKTFLPEIYNQLTLQAAAGDFQFIKLMLEHVEKLEEQRQKSSSATITFSWDPNLKQ